jgi:hypothetical protein
VKNVVIRGGSLLVSIMTDEELAVRPNLAEWCSAKGD